MKMSLKCHQEAESIFFFSPCVPPMRVKEENTPEFLGWLLIILVIKPVLSMIYYSLLDMQSHLMSLYLKISKMQLRLEV